MRQLTNRDFIAIEADIRDADALTRAVGDFAPDAIIHFAGLKAVGESNDLSLLYYQTNVTGTMNLLAAMDAAGCKRIVFSSSATAYGDAQYLPFDEDHPIARRPTPMAAPRRWRRASSATGLRRHRAYRRCCCAISIRSARMNRDGSEKIRTTFPTI